MDKPRPAQPRFEFAVLGDNPIDPKGAEGDILGFVELVRPFAARIGRSRENTPFTVGIYADWGQGKSSVMRLLQAELEGLDPPAICVWFYPWKYHTREEVWRGLILTLIHQVQASDTLARQLARRRGALSRLAAKWLWRTFTRVTGGIVPEKWADELVETVSKEPWSPAHLHRFEEQLDLLFRQLAPEAGGPGGAGAKLPLLVLMVDDLDRCLPEPAAAVLEALKLVLNRKGMVTVLGIAEGEVYRAIQALYARTLMAGEEGLRADWGRDYLRKIVQIPFHLPRVSEGAFEDYVGRCLERSAVAGALPRSADWRPVLRRACQENLREVKRFLNRFVAEWDKAEANAPRNQAVIGAKALDPARVAFVLAADNLADGFLDHCRTRSSELLRSYQDWFLAPLQEAETERRPPEGTEGRYLEDPGLERLFNDCLGEREGGPLVTPFRRWTDILPYLRFGRLPEESAAKEGPVPTEPSEVKKAAPRIEEYEDKVVIGGIELPKRKMGMKAAAAEDLDALLGTARRDLSEGRLMEAIARLQGGLTLAEKRGDPGAMLDLTEVLGEAAILAGEPALVATPLEAVRRVLDSLGEDPESAKTRVRAGTIRAELRGRLREALQDEAVRSDESRQAEYERVLGSLADRRPGVGPDPETGLPALAWVPIPGNDKLRLGDGLTGGPDPEYPEENERWPGEETLAVHPFYLAAYPVTNAQYRPFLEQEGYEQEEWWTRAGWEQLHAQDRRRSPAFWDDPQWNLDNHPVAGVTWYEAVAYARWLTARLGEAGALPEGWMVRLPSEAEWEWAARGPAGLRWPWGDEWPEDRLFANTKYVGLARSSAVGSFPPGERWFGESRAALPPVPGEADGIYDQAGNVTEWSSSLYWPYPIFAGDGRDVLDTDGERVVRGGYWGDDRNVARGAFRYGLQPGDFSGMLGFRLALSPANSGS